MGQYIFFVHSEWLCRLVLQVSNCFLLPLLMFNISTEQMLITVSYSDFLFFLYSIKFS